MRSSDGNRDERAAFYVKKAREVYKLGEATQSPELHAACVALAAHWGVLARIPQSDQISELVESAEAPDLGAEKPASAGSGKQSD